MARAWDSPDETFLHSVAYKGSQATAENAPMLKPLVLSLAAALASATVLHAETASVETQGRAPLNVNDLVAAGAPPVRDPRVIGPVIDMSGRMTSAERSVGDGDGTARTAVDYSLAPETGCSARSASSAWATMRRSPPATSAPWRGRRTAGCWAERSAIR